MILTGPQITREVERGAIVIDPFDPAAVGPNSYDYRLGPTLHTLRESSVDSRQQAETDEFELPADGFVLQPRRLYLGTTVETIGSSEFVPSLIGRSSLGRLGVYLQVSADLGNLGAVHRWTLEILAVQPVRVYPGMTVGQVSFWAAHGDRSPYTGYFGRFSQAVTPEPAMFAAPDDGGRA